KNGCVARPRGDAPPLVPVVGVGQACAGLASAVDEQLREAPGTALRRGHFGHPALAFAWLPAGDDPAAAEDRLFTRTGGVANAPLRRAGIFGAKGQRLLQGVGATAYQHGHFWVDRRL